MKVMIGCPIRDREWIVSDYLQCILDLKYPKQDIGLCFIVNDSTDGTMDTLLQFAEQYINIYDYIVIIKKNFNQVKDARISSVRQKIYETLPQLRNILLREAGEEKVDYLFSVDSDILFAPDTLTKLIESDKDIISAQIWNDKTETFPNVMIKGGRMGRIKHYKDFPKDEVFECDVTGAIYLLSQKVLDSDVAYSYHPQGEDVAFCRDAKEKGFSIWCDPTIQCEHIMDKGMLNE